MSMQLVPIGGIIGFAIGARASGVLGIEPLLGYVIPAVTAVLGMVLWSYSPLPDNNGGFMSGSQNTGWGWADD